MPNSLDFDKSISWQTTCSFVSTQTVLTKTASTFLSICLCGAGVGLAAEGPAVTPAGTDANVSSGESGSRAGAETTAAIKALGANPSARQISNLVFNAIRTSPADALLIVHAAVRVSPQAAVPEIVTAAAAAVPNPWKEVVYRRISAGSGQHRMRVDALPVQSAEHWAIHAQHARTDWRAVTEGENLALHRPVKFQPAPNYASISKTDDSKQLTDGEVVRPSDSHGDSHLWEDRRAVGWTGQPHVRMIVDLGVVKPVGRVAIRFQTAINNEDITPTQLKLALSDDGNRFYPVRTLTGKIHPGDSEARTFNPLPAADAGVHAITLEAGFAARFVQIDIESRGTVLCDEIAVLEADDAVPSLSGAPSVQHGRQVTDEGLVTNIGDGNRVSLAEAIARTAFDARPGLSLPELHGAVDLALNSDPAALLRNIQSPRTLSGVGDAGSSNYANEPLRARVLGTAAVPAPNPPAVSR